MRLKVAWGAAIIIILLAIWLTLLPPRAWLNLTCQVEVSPSTGAALVKQYACRNCHRIGGRGAALAPTLLPVVTAEDAERVRMALIQPRGAMPRFRLSDTQIAAIVAYLAAP